MYKREEKRKEGEGKEGGNGKGKVTGENRTERRVTVGLFSLSPSESRCHSLCNLDLPSNHHIVQDGLKLIVILLIQHLKCWADKHSLPHLAYLVRFYGQT